ncbi:hypothetical protein HPB50_026910 [Hyalomma asiaticum]|uniref:Uncharacterized protein n=1 Tax=Hyalomma asiaticum TaxID=266040 RepID=A0ACB7S9I3_HYAAI|nr:hypothetical protein HPB50_026910 [Hyalomma asiaticum]
MLSDPWRLQPAVPNVIGDDVSSDDDDDNDYYDDSGLADEIARKVREANARLRADITPLESSRKRRVQFRDPIRAVLFFTPDGEETDVSEEEEAQSYGRGDDFNVDDGAEDEDEVTEKAEDTLARSGAVRRLVTAAAVERRSSLTSEEPDEPSAVMMTAVGGQGSEEEGDVDDDFEQRMEQSNDSGDDVDSFESDDNASVSEDISELSSEGKVDNEDASVQEASGAAVVEDRMHSPEAASTASASSGSPAQLPAQKSSNSWDSSLEEAATSTIQEAHTNSGLSEKGDDHATQKSAVTSIDSPNRIPSPEVTLQPEETSVDASTPQEDGKQVATVAPMEKEPPAARPTVAVERPSTSPATLTAIYGASMRPKSVTTAGRTNGTSVRGAPAPTRPSSGRSGSVPNEADQRTRSQWNRAVQQTPLRLSAQTSRSVPSAKPTAKSPEHVNSQPLPSRSSTARQVQRQSPLGRGDRASSADQSKAERKETPTAVVRGTRSTYVLPRELKEELLRKKRRERELRLQREAREESERRQRALEAEQAFRAWLARKRREESLTRTDNSASRDVSSLHETIVAIGHCAHMVTLGETERASIFSHLCLTM